MSDLLKDHPEGVEIPELVYIICNYGANPTTMGQFRPLWPKFPHIDHDLSSVNICSLTRSDT